MTADYTRARERWNARYRANEGPTAENPRLKQYMHLLTRGLALDLASGIGQNARLLRGFHVILTDVADEALLRASGPRVLADAAALPFPPSTFDTIICTRFYDPHLDLASLLKPGGTLFFETFTRADQKYRPDLEASHRFDPATLPIYMRGLKTRHFSETDDGKRVFCTYIGFKD